MGEAACNELVRALATARSVCLLSGAGISAESGVPTFRGPRGLWREFRPEELATPEAFARDPKLVWEWYDWRRGLIKAIEPNRAHSVTAQMEAYFGDFSIITQNVDGLHQKAGANNVIELHGSLWQLHCTGCGRTEVDYRVPLDPLPPLCLCGHTYRPAVVWFGEAIPRHAMEASLSAVERCEVLFVVGTSGIVHPAASLPLLARERGSFVAEVNPEPTPLSQTCHVVLRGKAAEVLPDLWEGFLAREGG